MISSALRASSGCADFAEMPMFEPPAKTCAAPPSMPGRAKTPRFSSWSGQPGASASAGARIDHLTQLGAESCSVVPSQKPTSGLVSLPSLGAVEAVVMTSWTCASPASDSGLESCASHSSPSATAISPPFSQMYGRALYQSWPGHQMPDLPGFAAASAWPFEMYSSSVVGTVSPAAARASFL